MGKLAPKPSKKVPLEKPKTTLKTNKDFIEVPRSVKKVNRKTKKKIKKDEVLKKIDLTQKAFKEDADKKKRENSDNVVKDMKPLLDALPSLEEIFQFKKNLKTGVPAFDHPKSIRERKRENVAAKLKDFHDKLSDHKSTVENFKGLTSAQRRQAIREARLKRDQDLGKEMES